MGVSSDTTAILTYVFFIPPLQTTVNGVKSSGLKLFKVLKDIKQMKHAGVKLPGSIDKTMVYQFTTPLSGTSLRVHHYEMDLDDIPLKERVHDVRYDSHALYELFHHYLFKVARDIESAN